MSMLKPRPRSASPEATLEAAQKILPAAAPAGLRHAQALGLLLQQQAARRAGNALASASLPLAATQPDFWTEWLAMQGAVARRLQLQQQEWLRGCARLAQEYALIKRTRTLSEHMEQQYDLFAQFGQLLQDQMTGLLTLQENVEVDYGYWAMQRVRDVTGGDRSQG